MTDSLISHDGPGADIPDNILFNGKNVNSNGGGKRLQLTFEDDKRHLMHVVNICSDNYYKVGIGEMNCRDFETTNRLILDEHMMQVVAIDFVPVKPYMTQYVGLGVGELNFLL